MVKIPTIAIVFHITYQCNAACIHCCYYSSPIKKEHLPRNLLAKGLSEAVSLPSLKLVAFSGGEPFLRKNDLLWAIEQASKAGCLTRITSNGLWATDYQTAKVILETFRRAGLNQLSISYSDAHAQFIDFKKPIYALTASVDLEIDTAVYIVEGPSSFWNTGRFLEVLFKEAPHLADSEKFFTSTGYFQPTGRGKQNELPTLFSSEFWPTCPYVLTGPVIRPDGLVIACCGTIPLREPLSLGSLEEESLQTILQKAQENPLIIGLYQLGPSFLSQMTEAEETLSTSICHRCDLFLEHVERYSKEELRLFNQRLKEVLEKQADSEELSPPQPNSVSGLDELVLRYVRNP